MSEGKLLPREGAHGNAAPPTARDWRPIDWWESSSTSGGTQTLHKKGVSGSRGGGDVREVVV